jgi:multiple sugar transport system permease protein
LAAWERLLALPGLLSSLGNSVAISVGAATLAIALAAPAIAASWLLCLAFIWDEWIYASGLGYIEARSVPVLIQATGSGGGVNFGAATTRALAAPAVPVVAALLARRYMARVLSLGAVKG